MATRLFLALFLFLSAAGRAPAQLPESAAIDSLTALAALHEGESSAEARDVIVSLINLLCDRDLNRALEYVPEAEKLIEQFPSDAAQYSLSMSCSHLHRYHGELEEAEKYALRAQELAPKLDDPLEVFVNALEIAEIRSAQGCYDVALAILDPIRPQVEASENLFLKIDLALTIGSINLDCARYEEALANMLRAEILAHDLEGNDLTSPSYQVHLTNMVGAAYLLTDNFEKAISYFEECLELTAEDPELRFVPLVNLASCYSSLKRAQDSLDANFEALPMAEAVHDSNIIGTIHFNVVSDLIAVGRAEEAVAHARLAKQILAPLGDRLSRAWDDMGLGQALLANGELDEAKPLLLEAHEVALEMDDMRLLDRTYSELATFYEQMGMLTKTIEYLRGLQELNVLMSTQRRERIVKVQTQFEKLKREQHVAALSLAVEQERTIRLAVMGVAVFLVGLVVVALLGLRRQRQTNRQLREQTELAQKQRTELKILEGMLPICSVCKSIRDEDGSWVKLESYLHGHSEASFTHGYCPDCARRIIAEMKLAE